MKDRLTLRVNYYLPVVVGHLLVSRQSLHGPPQLISGHQPLLSQDDEGCVHLVVIILCKCNQN